MKSIVNSFWLWLIITRFEYTPCATSSSSWICSCGAAGAAGLLLSSSMAHG
jgi:hypothetical protein